MFVIHIITLFIFILVLTCVFHKSFVEMLPVGISGLVLLFLYEKKRTAEGAVKTVYRNSEGSVDYSGTYSTASGSDRSIREGGKLVG